MVSMMTMATNIEGSSHEAKNSAHIVRLKNFGSDETEKVEFLEQINQMGRGGGIVVSILAFYYNDPSSNLADFCFDSDFNLIDVLF